jgi:hypothetical protein
MATDRAGQASRKLQEASKKIESCVTLGCATSAAAPLAAAASVMGLVIGWGQTITIFRLAGSGVFYHG